MTVCYTHLYDAGCCVMLPCSSNALFQVQQALLEQSWPPSMHYHDAWDSPHTSALEGDPSQHSPSAAAADAAAGQRHSVDDGSHSPTNKNPNAPGLGLRPSLEMGLTWLRSLGPAAAAPDAASQVSFQSLRCSKLVLRWSNFVCKGPEARHGSCGLHQGKVQSSRPYITSTKLHTETGCVLPAS